MAKLDRLVEYVNTINDIAEMEDQLAEYTLLCATVPGFSNSLLPQLEDAIGRVDRKEFRTLLWRAFWMLAHSGLEQPQSRDLWKRIVTDYNRREQ